MKKHCKNNSKKSNKKCICYNKTVVTITVLALLIVSTALIYAIQNSLNQVDTPPSNGGDVVVDMNGDSHVEGLENGGGGVVELNSPYGIVKNIADEINDDFGLDYDKESAILSKSGSIWWITEDGYSFIFSGQGAVHYDYNFTEHEQPNSEVNGKANDPLYETATDIVRNKMKELGFIVNERNTAWIGDDNYFFDYVLAFEKGDLACVWTIVAGSEYYSNRNKLIGSFECSDNLDDSSHDKEKRFIDDLGYKNKDVILSISSPIDNFYAITGIMRMGSFKMIAKEENEKIIKIFAGQEVISCDLVELHSIPKEIYKSCMDYN